MNTRTIQAESRRQNCSRTSEVNQPSLLGVFIVQHCGCKIENNASNWTLSLKQAGFVVNQVDK